MTAKLTRGRLTALVSLTIASLMSLPGYQANAAPSADEYQQQLRKIRDAALASDWAFERLSDLTDLIGPRLSGSAGAAAAVAQVKQAMATAGMETRLQAIKVPHWERGVETAELVDYSGRPNGITQKIHLTALGNSGSTSASGMTAPVLVLHSFEEMEAKANEVKGKIVLFDVSFDQHLADAGMQGDAYGQAGRYRFAGPMQAGKLGAAAVLVRSVGGANFRLAHTGATRIPPGSNMPAAAVTAEDAMLISRLAKRGAVSMHLTVTPRTLPDADSYNVIAEIPGTDKADEVVLVSGHLDSWDLAQGATDDGAGVAAAMGVMQILKSMNLHPRRTIRFVAWMNEENGGRGAQAYFNAYRDKMDKHFAAIESDLGAGRPLGIMTSIQVPAVASLKALYNPLWEIGAGAVTRRDQLGSGDLGEMEEAGVPCFEPRLDSHDYFHYHHTTADTLDKVAPENLQKQVALLSVLTWHLANMSESLGRSARLPD